MSFTSLFEDDIPDYRRKNKIKKQRVKPDTPQKNIVETDTKDIENIKTSIINELKYLNGENYHHDYIVKVTAVKERCFRAIVFNKSNRKVLIDFFVENGGLGEYVFNPPLHIKSFTVNSYENQNQFSKIKNPFR